MLTCILIDDEQHAIDLLAYHIKKIDYLQVVKTFNNPLDALFYLDNNTVDLVFLDINMPEISGIELMKFIKNKADVIIVSAFREYALEGFENEALDYLLKPVSFERFLHAIQKAKEKIQLKHRRATDIYEDFIVLKTDAKNNFLKIDLVDIVYIEGLKNYVSVHTNNQRITAYLNMKSLVDKLSTERFIRVHKSYIVAINRLKIVNGNQVFLKDIEHGIPISEGYKPALLNILKQKLVENK